MYTKGEKESKNNMQEKLEIENKIVDLATEIISNELKNKSTPEREKYFILTLFKHIKEIRDSRRSLEITKVFLELSPKKTKRVTKQEQLIYHINNYLHEIYIFKLRVENLIVFIKKMYKKTTKKDLTHEFHKKMSTIINESFYEILKSRGSHVHKKRYQDKYINDMELYSLISSKSDEFQKKAELGYKATKFRWKNLAVKNNKELDKLVELLYKDLSKIIIGAEGIVLPSFIINHEKNQKTKK